MHPLIESLNPTQRDAVTYPAKPLLIIAGAGSGKTRILVHRIAYLIAHGVPSFQILGVTFTNKAAQEMKFRVQKLVQQDVWVSTFHSTCLKILRMDGPAIGMDKNFTIYDDHDQRVLVRECIRELQLNEKQIHPKGVVERISRAKDLLFTPEAYRHQAQDLYEEAVSKVYELYTKKLQTLRACDFGDLIMKTVQLFEEKSAVLSAWQDRFHHILIDEYQDTNHAQYRLVKCLASARKQITVVGDPDQSIYSWRGADINNILSFERDYPDCGLVKLEQNYRSTATILDAANELISRNTMRKPKALWTEQGDGEKISLYEAFNEKDEAEYVIKQVVENVSKGKTLADQVVFYRVHAQSRILEDHLRRAGIPYKIIGGVRFYDRKEIKDLIAYLRFIANPHDDVSLKRIINVPTRGIGTKAMDCLERLALSKNVSFHEAVRQAEAIPELTPKAQRTLKDFVLMFEKLRQERAAMDTAALLERVLQTTRYVKELEQEKTVEAQARIENIEEFFSVIQDFQEIYDASLGIPELESFLESISLSTDIDQWDSGTNVLTLMSLHTAKGLEFPVVYIIGLEEGIFPNVNSYTDDLSDLEEERRLCYVGITRARIKLHLAYARERHLYGSHQRNLPSRFLAEIPSELYVSTARFTLPDFDDLDDPPFAAEDENQDPDFTLRKRRILFD